MHRVFHRRLSSDQCILLVRVFPEVDCNERFHFNSFSIQDSTADIATVPTLQQQRAPVEDVH